MKRGATLTKIGPIESLSIPLVDGVVVLSGANGTGKTTAIDAVSKMLGGDGKVSATDGAVRGEVELGEAVLRVTRAKSRVVGEVEVQGLESKWDIATLIAPPIADPDAADAKRLKILVAGVKASPSMFYDLVGGAAEWDKLAVEQTTDVLLMAARVKKAFEARARQLESYANSQRDNAKAARDRCEGHDSPEETDETALAENFAAARSHADSLRQHNANAEAAQKAADKAKELLANIKALDRTAAEIDIELRAAELDEQAAIADYNATLAEINTLKEKARLLAESGNKASEKIRNLKAEAHRVNAIEKANDELRQQAKADVPPMIHHEAIVEADESCAKAKAAIDRGAAIRAARKEHAKAEEHDAAAKEAAKQADAARAKAADVDTLLSGLLPADCPLRVEAGRLVCSTDRSQSEPYAELSMGERATMAIRWAAKLLPPGGLLTLGQEFWESLDVDNRALVDREAKAAEVCILTAEATSGDLRAVPFGSDEEESE